MQRTPTALVINPPFERPVFRDHYCSSEAKSTYLWHPLDLMIQGACLADAGWRVAALDAVALELDSRAAEARIRQVAPDVVVALVSERTWASDRRLLEFARQIGVRQVVASGDFLRFGSGPVDEARGLIDLVVTDFTTTALVDSLAAGRPEGGGVATVDDVAAHRPRDLGRAPLAYPCPDQRLFAPASYRLPYPGFVRFASILTGYGCPFHCLYCHVGELGYRIRPVDHILEEIRRSRAAGCEQIYFRDATINARKGHMVAWAQRIIAEGLVTPWAAFATAQPMDDELAALLSRSGCQHLQIGVETLDDSLRDDNGKPFDGGAHREFVDICRRHDIGVTAHLVFGLPGETEQTLERTVSGIASSGFDYVAVNLAEDRPGVPWRAQGVQLPIAPAGSNNGSAGALDQATLERWQSRAYRSFYLRPERLAQELGRRLMHGDVRDALPLARDVGRWFKG